MFASQQTERHLGDLSPSMPCTMSNVTQSVFGKMKAIQCCNAAQTQRSWVQLHDTYYDADNAKDPEMPVSLSVQSAKDMAHTAARRLPSTISIPMVNMPLVHPSMPYLCLRMLRTTKRAPSEWRSRQADAAEVQRDCKWSVTAHAVSGGLCRPAGLVAGSVMWQCLQQSTELLSVSSG